MSENYKILAQVSPKYVEPNSKVVTPKVAYSVPAGSSAIVSDIIVNNNGSTSASYKIGVVKADDVETSETFFPDTMSGFEVIRSFNNYFLWTGENASNFSEVQDYNVHSYNVMDIVRFNDIFVGFVYYNDKFFTSSTAKSWTQSTSSLPFPIQGEAQAATSSNRLVVLSVGSKNAAVTTDLTTWTQVTLPVPSPSYDAGYRNIIWGSDRFYALPESTGSSAFTHRLAHSTDGITWQQSEFSMGGYTARGVAYGNGRVVVATASQPIYSTDLSTWSLPDFWWSYLNLPSGRQAVGIYFANGKFIVPITESGYAYSTDAVSWSLATHPSGYTPRESWNYSRQSAQRMVADSGPNILLAPNMGNSGRMLVSTDGTSWSESGTIFTNSQPVNAVYGFDNFIGEHTKLTMSDAQTMVAPRSISTRTRDEISSGITLSSGDQLRVFSTADNLNISVFGVEV